MLVLARRVGEEIVINGNVRITVLETRGGQVRLGITAPPTVPVLRSEVLDRRPQSSGPPLCHSDGGQSSSNDSPIMPAVIPITRIRT